MEVAHADLTEEARVILIEHDAVVVLTTGITATTRMLPVLANAAVAGTDVSALLAVLPQACMGRNIMCISVAAGWGASRASRSLAGCVPLCWPRTPRWAADKTLHHNNQTCKPLGTAGGPLARDSKQAAMVHADHRHATYESSWCLCLARHTNEKERNGERSGVKSRQCTLL